MYMIKCRIIIRAPNFVIFGIMVHDPLYFKVGIFRDQPTPPICLKIPKCANFSTL